MNYRQRTAALAADKAFCAKLPASGYASLLNVLLGLVLLGALVALTYTSSLLGQFSATAQPMTYQLAKDSIDVNP